MWLFYPFKIGCEVASLATVDAATFVHSLWLLFGPTVNLVVISVVIVVLVDISVVLFVVVDYTSLSLCKFVWVN